LCGVHLLQVMVCIRVLRAGVLLPAAMFFTLPTGAVELEPGFWELTTKFESEGDVSERPLRSRCISATAAAAAGTVEGIALSAGALAKLEEKFGKDACRLIETRNSTDVFSWWLACSGNHGADQTGIARFDGPKHFTVEIRTVVRADGLSRSSITKLEGRHKGECP
jgi:hypothetical protein